MRYFSKKLLVLLPILFFPNSYGGELAEKNMSQSEDVNSELSELAEMRSMLIEEECKSQCRSSKEIHSCIEECKKNEYKKATMKKTHILSSGVKK